MNELLTAQEAPASYQVILDTPHVRQGYKQTEVGVVPEDWNVAELGDIGECLIGLTYKPSNVKADGTLVLRSSNVQDSSLSFDDNVYVDADIPQRIRVIDGDILVCVRNGSRTLIGKCALLDKRVVGQTFGAFMSVYRTASSAYIFQQFQSALIKRQITENIGATINQITNRNLNSFKVPFPTDDKEREAIATALSEVDALLAAQDKLIVKKRDIKQATMQQLLTGKQRLPGFTGEWEVRRLGDVASITRGASPRPIESPIWFDEHSTVGWVRISDVTKSDMFLRETTQRLSALGVKNSRPVSKGGLIMSICATVGKPVITEIDTCIHDGFVVFYALQLNQRFLYYSLKFIESSWGKQGVNGQQVPK